MLANSLTREVGLKVGPVLLEVLVKHYFDRLKKDPNRRGTLPGTGLRQEDVLYDEAFTIVKAFLNAASLHTVEELQGFSNTRTPSPPWVHVVRILVPMCSCDEAATYLIKALGGEDIARKLVGGVKWWQVRGINGVDGQWITARKDWKEAKRQHKMRKGQTHESQSHDSTPLAESGKDQGLYEKNMDTMRCILYLHGGGYYFGSVDQERYSIQRLARKINGRVFAINYRLAPQYPFPCAIQDALAAYLFLIRPPPGAEHQAIKPEHIVIGGDSAGGGLSLALLQVIRDAGLPLPAGGLLISPWCDLTHSFPSIHTNTATDIIAESGLSFHKPSPLWPPPSPEISNRVHASLRHRIRQTFKMRDSQPFEPTATVISERQVSGVTDASVEVESTMAAPPVEATDPQNIFLTTASGEKLEIDHQVHLYTQNSLITHPLVSPSLSYLGGLPPLLFIVGDKEVLRDEIIYTAHKAANPENYPLTDAARELYPPLEALQSQNQPTSVHIQIYDDTAHILPILFAFTTPAKFCFRAMATFCKFVTRMQSSPSINSNGPLSPVALARTFSPEQQPPDSAGSSTATISPAQQSPTATGSYFPTTGAVTRSPTTIASRKSLRRTLSIQMTRAGTVLRRRATTTNLVQQGSQTGGSSPSSSDVAGPRFNGHMHPVPSFEGERAAGDPWVYHTISNPSSWNCEIIRERVDIRGVIRPMEPRLEMDALRLPAELIGSISEPVIRRFMKYRDVFDNKFSHTVKSVERHRRQNLERAKADTIKRMSSLRQTLRRDVRAPRSPGEQRLKEGLISSPGWGWAWALDEGEDPPPSSLVSRRDTEEARKLAEIADQAFLGEDHRFSGNNLWSVVINFLTVAPGKNREDTEELDAPEASPLGTSHPAGKPRSKISRIMTWDGHPRKGNSI